MYKKRPSATLILESGTYEADDLADMSLSELTSILDEITDTMTDIRNQLDHAHADYITEGISSDFKWHTKAKMKLRILERFRQKIGRLSKKKKVLLNKANRSTSDIFVDIAKVELPSSQFSDILERALKEKAMNEKIMKGELHDVDN